MHPTHRNLLTLLAALALVAAPLVAGTLGGGEGVARGERAEAGGGAAGGERAGAGAARLGPVRDAGATRGGIRGALRARWPRLAAIPAPAPPHDAQAVAGRRAAVRTARALRAALRERVAVLVDKRRSLPPHHRPRDLVVPRVRFLAGVQGDARLMRRRAARALERLFAAGRRDGVALAGVSGFRSYAAQRALFGAYASERGVRRASHVSARAGHSEHQTGLVMDVAGAGGRCAASACFAGTRPARWLSRNAHRHGFVVRYPAGRQAVTGYAHEPWHLRYVGAPLAREAARTHRTLDELLRPARARRG